MTMRTCFIFTIILILSACHRTPPDPTRVTFYWDFKYKTDGFSVDCGYDTFNGQSPNSSHILTSETAGQKDIRVQCKKSSGLFSNNPHIYAFNLVLDAKPGQVYALRALPTEDSIQVWLQTEDGVKVTPLVAGQLIQ